MNETWWVNSGQLDSDQKKVLQADPKEGLLIQGPPGSGKTNILLLRANYVRSVAPRILFITFTRTLTEFIRSGPSIGRSDQIRSQEITTFMAWGKKFLSDSGAPFSDPGGGFKKSRTALIEALEAFLLSANPGVVYDSVFVDEVQDFYKRELAILQRLSGTMNAAGDLRQAIWEHREGLPAMQAIATEVVELHKHYRIGLHICRFADRILPPKLGEPDMEDGCSYDEQTRPSSVTPISCANEREQYRACIAELKRQIRYISDEPILVLAHAQKTRDAFWNALEQDGELLDRSILQSSEGYEAFGPNSLVRVMTIASSKGSEARAVHLLRADRLTTGMRELAFTAVTRAKTEVALYHTASLASHLEPKADSLPELDDIF